MIPINKYILVFLLLLSNISNAQQREILRKLIASDLPIEVRQKQLDSFFNAETKKMSPKTLADCYHDYGARWYFGVRSRFAEDVSLLDRAIHFTKKAVEIRKTQDSIDYKELKKSLYNIGFFSYTKEDFFAAIDVYTELIALGHTDIKTMQTHRAIANAYTRVGDFYKATYHLQKVISFCREKPEYAKLSLDTYLDYAYRLAFMGYKEYSHEIHDNLRKADSILKRMNWVDNFRESQIRQIEGNRLLETGDYTNAIPIFEQSLSALHREDSLNLAIVYNSLALANLKLNNYNKGVQYAEKSIQFDSQYSLPHQNLGDYYVEQNEFKKGLQHYQIAISKALGTYQKDQSNTKIDSSRVVLAANKPELLEHFIAKANSQVLYYRVDKNKEHLISALKTFQLADRLVDVIRFESTEFKSKLFWREKGADLYIKAVEVCYLLQLPEEAYYFLEKNKAILLLEDLTNEQAKLNARLPPFLAKREFELKRKISLAENKLLQSEQFSTVHKDSIKDRIYHLKRDYSIFVDSLGIAFPSYANFKKKVHVLEYPYFKDTYTKDNDVVIQYILNSSDGFGLVTSDSYSILFRISRIDTLYSDIVYYREKLLSPFITKEDKVAYTTTAHRIYQSLLPETVRKSIEGKKITVIPDDILQQVPFETLIANKDDMRYLIQSCEIRYAYSISFLDQKKRIKHDPNNGFIAFAPVQFTKEDLGNLYNSKREVERIREIIGGEVLLNAKASKSSFLDTVSNYRIIHLSTHADVGTGQSPWIAFADEKMSLTELYATKNQSDMVVLSACNTSMGALKKGEGIMSLARGFFYSGAHSVVSSLWSANDKANQEVMIHFYENLSQGFTKSKALRKAKLSYINSHSGTEASPFYWGALILIGDNSKILTLKHEISWLIMGICILMILIFLLHYFKKKKRSL